MSRIGRPHGSHHGRLARPTRAMASRSAPSGRCATSNRRAGSSCSRGKSGQNRRGNGTGGSHSTSHRSLASPIVTTRRRQSVFIYSDLCRLPSAVTVNDLWCDSPLEDEFWRGLKARNIPAERQWPTYGQDAAPAIFDFAVFCANEDIDIEVDGEQHHTVPDISRNDCRRDNASQLKGFRTLRFDSRRVRTDLDDCLNDVEQMIRQCGGLERAAAPADAVLNAPGRPSQLPLFAPDARPRGGDSRRTPRRTRATRPQAQLSGTTNEAALRQPRSLFCVCFGRTRRRSRGGTRAGAGAGGLRRARSRTSRRSRSRAGLP